MNDERTENLPDGPSFEDRVLARFDGLNTRLDGIDQRLQRLEEKTSSFDQRLQRLEENTSSLDQRLQRLEEKAYDTKPIWERALAEILATGQKLDGIERKLNVLGRDMLTLRADQTRLEDRFDKIESKPV